MQKFDQLLPSESLLFPVIFLLKRFNSSMNSISKRIGEEIKGLAGLMRPHRLDALENIFCCDKRNAAVLLFVVNQVCQQALPS